MLYCAQSNWFLATLCFTFASTFRSNGILLSGFILWGLLIQPFLTTAKPPTQILTYVKSIVYSALIFSPFIYHQTTGYLAFCTGNTIQPWCSKSLPLIYSHVQSTYWNSGFLRYWTFEQLPNFIIAVPPFLVIFSYVIHTLTSNKVLSSSITPHAIHACVLCWMLLFNSHTQIILRLAPSMPLVYWAAAWLVINHPMAGKWWVGWSLLWGMVSVLLWSVFLPPA